MAEHEFDVGCVVEYRTIMDRRRVVRVTYIDDDKGVFDGVVIEGDRPGMSVWGWLDDVTEVVGRPEGNGSEPRSHAGDAFATFLSMSHRTFLAATVESRGGLFFEPAEREGYERARVARGEA